MQIAARLSMTAREVLTGQERATYSATVRAQSYQALARRGLVEWSDHGWTRTDLGEKVAQACASPSVEVSARLRAAAGSTRRAYKALADVPIDGDLRAALTVEVEGLQERIRELRAKLAP